jgi:hypothetical protein
MVGLAIPHSSLARLVSKHTPSVRTPSTWGRKITHLRYVLGPFSVLQSDQSSSRVPSESFPLPERPGFSLASTEVLDPTDRDLVKTYSMLTMP